MSIALLSTTGLGTTTLAGAMSSSRNAWSSLGEKLSEGDLTSARAAFSVYKRLTSNAANNANTQYASALSDLNSALTTGNLSGAKTAYAAVTKDVASDPVLAINNAAATAQKTGQWIADMISFGGSGSSSSSGTSDPYSYILNTAYDQLGQSDSTTSTNDYGTSSYLAKVYGVDSSSTDTSSNSTSTSTSAADSAVSKVRTLLSIYA